MRIALLGYGKMGKAIEEIAEAKGHKVVLKVSRDPSYNLSNVDVAIDFSIPEMAVTHLTNCLEAGIPVVSGTTGWLKDYEKIKTLCEDKKGAFLYASNFSVGVNIFFELNKRLAELMAPLSDYKVALEEIHHTQKLDAPSGTAITLAEGIMANSNNTQWKLVDEDYAFAKAKTIPITSKRRGQVPGTHTINYKSAIDTITIKHEAHSRAGFAQGALLAAEWLVEKKGVFSMRDVLNIS